VVSGHDNTATGFAALYSNTGSYNTADGSNALSSVTSAQNCVGVGYNAGANITTSFGNTAVGMEALQSVTTGSYDTAIGYLALSASTGSHNTAVGTSALQASTTAWDNTAIGDSALYYDTTGEYNVATGASALGFNTTGYQNTAIGVEALYSNTTAQDNTAVGFEAEFNIAGSAFGNTALGSNAGINITSGTWNTSVGAYSGVAAAGSGFTNTTALGYGAVPSASNSVVVGNNSVTSIGGYANWTNLSDGRFKKNVKENVPGLAFIEKLKPVTFNYDLDKLAAFDGATTSPTTIAEGEAREAKQRKLYTGFVAQQVEDAARQCEFDFSGVVKPENEKAHYQLSYADFVVPLVRAVQEQQAEIDGLKSVIKTLKARDGSARIAPVSGEMSMFSGLIGTSGANAAMFLGIVLALIYSRRSKRETVASS